MVHHNYTRTVGGKEESQVSLKSFSRNLVLKTSSVNLGSCIKYSSLLFIMGFSGGSERKKSTCNVGDLRLTPGLGRSPGGGHSNPLQYSGLENPHGQRSLAGYSPRGHKELDMTEAAHHS